MEAIVAASIAAVPLTITAWNSVKNRRAMAVSNGETPGMMIEHLYKASLNHEGRIVVLEDAVFEDSDPSAG